MDFALSRKGSKVSITAASEAAVMIFIKIVISDISIFDYPSAVTGQL
jgi:hypothetical protein